MKLALGYAETFDAYGASKVFETLTCAHCGKIYKKPEPGQPFGFCNLCFKATCLPCGRHTRCDPFEKKLKRMEQQNRLRKSF